MKNFSRLVKNPIGYSYWKSKSFFKNRPFILLFWGYMSLYSIYKLNGISAEHRKREKYLTYLGKEEIDTK